MSVTSVQSLSAEGGYAEDLSRTYTARWRVVTNSRNDGPRTILSAAGLPKYGDPFAFGSDTDSNATVRSASASLESVDATLRSYIVTLQYSSRGGSADPQDNASDDPTDWGWKISGDADVFMKAPETDIDGRALVNLVEEPFVVEIEDPQPTLILEKNTKTISLTQWAQAQKKVNQNDIWGLPKRTVKLKKWAFAFAYTGPNQAYVQNRFEVGVNFSGFFFKPPNQGRRQKVGVDIDGKAIYEAARGDDFTILSEPRNLDSAGAFLIDGGAPTFFDQVAGPLQRFKLEEEYDFSSIFPATLPGPFVP